MIAIKEFPNLTFENKEQLFKALVENKSTLIAQKKMQLKETDATLHYVVVENSKGEAVKAESANIQDATTLKSSLVINTTNLLDSHGDVHLKGIWKKSSKEAKNVMLLQEHKMTFDKIITDNVRVNVSEMNWTDLGFNFKGTTEALMFDAIITKERNPFMFEQYSKGYVKEHSVGMRYVKIDLAVNSEDKWYIEEKEIWDKYIEDIANKEDAIEQGYFWAVTEAKIVEGSAVVKGSNYATPTLNIEAVKDTSKQEPSNDTQKNELELFLKTILKN